MINSAHSFYNIDLDYHNNTFSIRVDDSVNHDLEKDRASVTLDKIKVVFEKGMSLKAYDNTCNDDLIGSFKSLYESIKDFGEKDRKIFVYECLNDISKRTVENYKNKVSRSGILAKIFNRTGNLEKNQEQIKNLVRNKEKELGETPAKKIVLKEHQTKPVEELEIIAKMDSYEALIAQESIIQRAKDYGWEPKKDEPVRYEEAFSYLRDLAKQVRNIDRQTSLLNKPLRRNKEETWETRLQKFKEITTSEMILIFQPVLKEYTSDLPKEVKDLGEEKQKFSQVYTEFYNKWNPSLLSKRGRVEYDKITKFLLKNWKPNQQVDLHKEKKDFQTMFFLALNEAIKLKNKAMIEMFLNMLQQDSIAIKEDPVKQVGEDPTNSEIVSILTPTPEDPLKRDLLIQTAVEGGDIEIIILTWQRLKKIEKDSSGKTDENNDLVLLVLQEKGLNREKKWQILNELKNRLNIDMNLFAPSTELTDGGRCTPLIECIRRGDYVGCEILLDLKASPVFSDVHGKTPLENAERLTKNKKSILKIINNAFNY